MTNSTIASRDSYRIAITVVTLAYSLYYMYVYSYIEFVQTAIRTDIVFSQLVMAVTWP